jgi:hypothetical protein
MVITNTSDLPENTTDPGLILVLFHPPSVGSRNPCGLAYSYLFLSLKKKKE